MSTKKMLVFLLDILTLATLVAFANLYFLGEMLFKRGAW